MNSSLFVAMFYTDIEITQIFIFLYRSSKLYFQTESTVKYWCFRLIGFHNELSTKKTKSIHLSATSMNETDVGRYILKYIMLWFWCLILSESESIRPIKHVKRRSGLGDEEPDFGEDLSIFELDRWNLQQMLYLGFPETSQSLSWFKQLLFYRGYQRKKNLALHFLILVPF